MEGCRPLDLRPLGGVDQAACAIVTMKPTKTIPLQNLIEYLLLNEHDQPVWYAMLTMELYRIIDFLPCLHYPAELATSVAMLATTPRSAPPLSGCAITASSQVSYNLILAHDTHYATSP